MNTEKAKLILIKLKKSHQTLRAAKLLFENDFFNEAVGRLYYACFYAVNVLLLSEDIRANKHSGVKQMFGLHFVSPGIIDIAASKFYTELFEMRQDGDYEDLINFEKEEVAVLFPLAEVLIGQIEQYLSNHIGNE